MIGANIRRGSILDSLEIERLFKLFNISQRWLEYDILSFDELLSYGDEYEKEGRAHNLEHYSLFILGSFLERAEELSDDDIEEGMKGEALSWLLKCSCLTDRQFEDLADYILYEKRYNLSKKVKKIALHRKLEAGSDSRKVLIECAMSGEPTIQNELLSINELPREVLRILIE